jgi:hypothetical protein
MRDPKTKAWLSLVVSFALRRQRSHVRIVSGAPVKSETFARVELSRNAQCHHSVTDKILTANAFLKAFSTNWNGLP